MGDQIYIWSLINDHIGNQTIMVIKKYRRPNRIWSPIYDWSLINDDIGNQTTIVGKNYRGPNRILVTKYTIGR